MLQEIEFMCALIRGDDEGCNQFKKNQAFLAGNLSVRVYESAITDPIQIIDVIEGHSEGCNQISYF